MSNSVFQNSLAGAASPQPQARPGFGSFDMNVVMVLSVLLCALICSLGLNAIVKCASTLVASMSNHNGNSSIPLGHHKGVRRNALKKFPTVEYSKEANKLGGMDGECVICLSEFEAGDRLRLLPNCHHAFHIHCIDKWLNSHTSCPKCRNSLTHQHQHQHHIASACSDAAANSSSPPPPESVVVNIIAPLQREGLMCNYRDMESSSSR